MIRLERAEPGKIVIDRSEVMRYLGCKKDFNDPALVATVDDCIAQIKANLLCVACYDMVPIEIEREKINFGFTKVTSASLAKNLAQCSQIYVFAATIGFAADRIIQKYSLLSPLHAVAAQAAGAAAIEAWCDLLCHRLKEYASKNSLYMRPRFSPGYGDFSLEYQRDIFSFLDCPRKVGIKLTDSLLMTPSKSVSAVVGLSKFDCACVKHGCEVCTNLDCAFRRV